MLKTVRWPRTPKWVGFDAYLVPTENDTKYVVAVEPFDNAQGLKEVWEIDGRTGKASVYRSPSGESLFGPRKAAKESFTS